MQMKSANPLQTSNLSKKTNRTCKFISKKCKNHSLSTSQSLPNNFSILKGNTILVWRDVFTGNF
jgi:hypothetical protein